MSKLDLSELTCKDVLEALEQTWGVKLPEAYKKFLLKNINYELLYDYTAFSFKNKEDGNGSFIDNFFMLVKGENNLLMHIKNYRERIPINFIPIANDPGGNLILLSLKGPDRGKIYFWDHNLEADTDQGEIPDYSNLTLIADSFNEFIDGLYEYKDEDAEE